MKYRAFFLIVCAGILLSFGCSENNPLAPELATVPETESTRLLSKTPGQPEKVTVMTRNIYVGTAIDVNEFSQIMNPQELVLLVNEALNLLASTNFLFRAPALAQEIAEALPHLVGLQEVAIIQLPGQPTFDYLSILLTNLNLLLANTGFSYSVVGIVNNVTLAFPGIVELSGVSLLNRDVVLARSDVAIESVLAANYSLLDATLFFNILGTPIPFLRGFVALNATIGKQTYRFVNTHLENADAAIRMKQAEELTDLLSNETRPVILVGDFNTAAPTGATYQFLEDQGFVDVWPRRRLKNQNPNGFTSPHDADLRNPVVKLNKRIDIIFARNQAGPVQTPGIGPVSAFVVGDELDDRILTPLLELLWPSDHAGVVAELQLPNAIVMATALK